MEEKSPFFGLVDDLHIGEPFPGIYLWKVGGPYADGEALVATGFSFNMERVKILCCMNESVIKSIAWKWYLSSALDSQFCSVVTKASYSGHPSTLEMIYAKNSPWNRTNKHLKVIPEQEIHCPLFSNQTRDNRRLPPTGFCPLFSNPLRLHEAKPHFSDWMKDAPTFSILSLRLNECHRSQIESLRSNEGRQNA